ncbi:MAG: hypothetical protein ACOCSE_04700 [Chitinivibrionales bacterium]
MKKLIFPAIVIVAGGLFYLFFLESGPLEKARKAEKQGETKEALDHYVTAIKKSSQEFKYVKTKDKPSLSPKECLNKIREYYTFISSDKAAKDTLLDKAVEGALRLNSTRENENLTTGPRPKRLFGPRYERNFHENFLFTGFFKKAKDESLPEGILETLEDKEISMLHIKTESGYTYECFLLDLYTGNNTSFELFPKDSVTLLVKPETEYYLFSKTTVKFSNGGEWSSPWNIMNIETDDDARYIIKTLKTRVNRKKIKQKSESP